MPSIGQSGKPQSRRYTPDEKAAAVRMVMTLRVELGTKYGTVKRVAEQFGYGQETVRSWVRQAEIDTGDRPGETTAEQARIKELEQENRELKRANSILRSASAFFATELDRPHR
jgi:transposase